MLPNHIFLVFLRRQRTIPGARNNKFIEFNRPQNCLYTRQKEYPEPIFRGILDGIARGLLVELLE